MLKLGATCASVCRIAAGQLSASTVQPTRTAVVVSRMYDVYPRKEGQNIRLRRKNYVYKFEYDTNNQKSPPVNIVFTKDLEGFGQIGDVVTVKAGLARNFLLPNNYATYATPEAIEEYQVYREKRGEIVQRTATALKTMRALSYMHLPVPMNPDIPWLLNKKHLKVALRLQGVVVEENQIYLPPEPITEPGKIEFGVSVNDLDIVRVQGTAYHKYQGRLEEEQPDLPPVFIQTEVPLGQKPRDIVYWEPPEVSDDYTDNDKDPEH